MILVTEIHIPCCTICHDWMQPVMMIEHPFQGVVWVCLNGHASLVEGEGDRPRSDEIQFLSSYAQFLAGVS